MTIEFQVKVCTWRGGCGFLKLVKFDFRPKNHSLSFYVGFEYRNDFSSNRIIRGKSPKIIASIFKNVMATLIQSEVYYVSRYVIRLKPRPTNKMFILSCLPGIFHIQKKLQRQQIEN